MRTEMLFMKDCYLKEFEAKVLERGSEKGRDFVVLDRTAFCPSGGGQPSDKGTLNGVKIFEVRKDSGVIKHFLEKPIDSENVHGVLEWDRRYAFMRMHSAQHILSGIMLDKWVALTTGNQIDSEKSFTDFQFSNPPEDLEEFLTKSFNECIDREIPVKIHITTREEALKATNERRRNLFSRVPESVKEIRIVEIGGVDKVPCAGTHVSNTKEIGHINIIKIEDKGNETLRVRFKLEGCPDRAS